MLPAAYVCVSVWVCVSRHLWLPEFLSWKSVCVRVCVKQIEKCLPTGQRWSHARESKAAATVLSLCCISYLQINVQCSSLAELCYNETTTGLNTVQQLWSILIQDVDSLYFAENRFVSSIATKWKSYQRGHVVWYYSEWHKGYILTPNASMEMCSWYTV